MLRGHWFPEDELQTKFARAFSVNNTSLHP